MFVYVYVCMYVVYIIVCMYVCKYTYLHFQIACSLLLWELCIHFLLTSEQQVSAGFSFYSFKFFQYSSFFFIFRLCWYNIFTVNGNLDTTFAPLNGCWKHANFCLYSVNIRIFKKETDFSTFTLIAVISFQPLRLLTLYQWKHGDLIVSLHVLFNSLSVSSEKYVMDIGLNIQKQSR